MELVQEHGPDAAEGRVGEHAAGEDPLGHEANPGPRARYVLEAHLVADARADLLAELLRHSLRGQAGSQPPRLQDDNLPLGFRFEQRTRDARRLPCAGWCLEDQASALGEGSNHLREERVDGKGGKQRAEPITQALFLGEQEAACDKRGRRCQFSKTCRSPR